MKQLSPEILTSLIDGNAENLEEIGTCISNNLDEFYNNSIEYIGHEDADKNIRIAIEWWD